MEAHYLVSGMTCDHCVAHVTEEVSAIPGVEKVDVSREGPMVVHSSSPIDFSAIQAAVAEAGEYTVSES